MSTCPADMSGIHALDGEGVCLNCDAGHVGDGCYICQPGNPNAAEEGCEACDREYWTAVLQRQSLERSGGGTSQTRFILASMNSVPPLSDAEQDALIEWLNSTGAVRRAMTAGVLADLYRVVAAIAELRCECKTTIEAE